MGRGRSSSGVERRRSGGRAAGLSRWRAGAEPVAGRWCAGEPASGGGPPEARRRREFF